jgi:molecular chaperone Hsp33
MGGVLMGALLKGDQRVALKFEGNGPIDKILIEAEATGRVAGYVGNPKADLPPKGDKFDVGGLLGQAGLLTVTKDLRLKEPYSGTVHLYSSTIAKDLAYYLTESEQIPSAVGLGVLLDKELRIAAAGGFIIQSLPPADDSAIDIITERISSMPSITEMIREGGAPLDILRFIFDNISIELLEERPIFFECHCSKERMEQALIALGKEELDSIAREEQDVTLRCDFCNETYHFKPDELKALVQ